MTVTHDWIAVGQQKHIEVELEQAAIRVAQASLGLLGLIIRKSGTNWSPSPPPQRTTLRGAVALKPFEPLGGIIGSIWTRSRSRQ